MKLFMKRLLRREIPVLILMAMLLIGGAVGYHFIEGMTLLDGLYMTVITISTVGFQEVSPLGPSGRLFTVVLIISGAGILAYIMGTAANVLMEGEWRHHLERRWRLKMLSKMRNHAVLCGFGRVGRHALRELLEEGIKCVVIEPDADKALELKANGHLVVQGDATEESVLREAAVERAQYLIAALHSDADNVFIVLTARGLNPGITIVARANAEESEPKLRKAGADQVISLYQITAHRMVTMLLRPEIGDFLDHVVYAENVDFLLEHVMLASSSKLVGQTLEQAGIRAKYGVTVLAHRPPDTPVFATPAPDTVFRPGSCWIVLGTKPELEAFRETADPS